MTDSEIDLFVQALFQPPPFGFSKTERKQIIDWIKNPSVFVEIAEKRQEPK